MDKNEFVDPNEGLMAELTFRKVWLLWRSSFRSYSMPLVHRVKACWAAIEEWTSENIPEIHHSLSAGASEGQIFWAEQELGLPRLCVHGHFCACVHACLTDS